jgi:hypothetical protein
MEMDAVLANVRDLCGDPLAWAILGAIVLKSALSMRFFFSCPYVQAARDVAPAQARAMLERRTVHNPRFLIGMAAALVLTVGGLYAARAPELGAAPLAAIVVGVFIMLVAPSELWISDGTLRVAAARSEGRDALAFAVDRLRWAHIERIGIELSFAAALALLILSF